MTKSSKLSRVAVVSTLVLTLCGITLAAAGTTGPAKPAEDPLKLVPADSVFCVRINNLNAALGQMDMFLVGLFPAGVSVPVKTQLGQLLGSPEPVGVNMSGSFVLFGPLSDSNATGMIGGLAMLVPITDYSKFISGNPNIKPANVQGISSISAQQDGATASVIQLGSYALAMPAGNDNALLAAKKAMSGAATGVASNLDAAELKRAAGTPVWAYLNVPVVAKKYGSMIKTGIETAKAMAGAMQGQAAMASQARAQMDMGAAMLDSLMNETRFITLSLEPSAAAIRTALVVAALPDTQMADSFKGSPSKIDAKMLGYLRDGAAVNFVGSFDPARMNKFNTLYLDMFVKFMGKDLSADDVAKIKKLTGDYGDVLGGAIAGALTVNPQSKLPFDLQYAAALKDAAKVNQMLDEVVKMMSPGGAMANLYKSMGMKTTVDFKRKAATYKGVDIDSLKVGMSMTDANSPANSAITAMYGSGMDLRLAATDNLLVYALASDPNVAIRALIDQVKAGGPVKPPAEVQTAMQLIPDSDKGSFFVTINVLRLTQMVAAMSPVPVPTTQPSTPSQSDIAIAGTCGDGKLSIEMAVPKTQVMEIMNSVVQMQQQQMQPQPTPQTQPQTQPQQVQPPTPPTVAIPRGTANYTIDIQVQFNSQITQGQNRLMVELRKGVPGSSSVFDTKYFEGQVATVSFSQMPAGSYFVAIGNGDSVAVGPVRQFSDGQSVRTRMSVTYSSGNVGTRSRSSL
jgi:hypothetical protein